MFQKSYRLYLALLITLLLTAGNAWAQSLRIATWNVTNFTGSGNFSAQRAAAFQTAIYGSYQGRSLSPDVLMGQEFTSQTGITSFLNILNTAAGSPGDWAASAYNSTNDGALFYRTSKVSLTSSSVLTSTGSITPPRSTGVFNIQIASPAGNQAMTLYNVHMKAGNTTSDEAERKVEADRIRTHAQGLGTNANFLVAGDMNVYTSTEDPYTSFTGSQTNNNGRFFDPINTPGSWNNNNAYRFVHTQDPSPATNGGGVDDRFDQLLLSASLLDRSGLDYKYNYGAGTTRNPYSTTTWDDPNHSYRVWGNDGSSFNQPLTVDGNQMVGATIAQALRDSTISSNTGNYQGGHLPVYLDLILPSSVAPEPGTFVLVFGAGLIGGIGAWTRRRKKK